MAERRPTMAELRRHAKAEILTMLSINVEDMASHITPFDPEHGTDPRVAEAYLQAAAEVSDELQRRADRLDPEAS